MFFLWSPVSLVVVMQHDASPGELVCICLWSLHGGVQLIFYFCMKIIYNHN